MRASARPRRAPSSRECRTGHAEHAGLLLLLVLQLDGVLLLLLVQRLPSRRARS